jgi:hypothetical protein
MPAILYPGKTTFLQFCIPVKQHACNSVLQHPGALFCNLDVCYSRHFYTHYSTVFEVLVFYAELHVSTTLGHRQVRCVLRIHFPGIKNQEFLSFYGLV